MKHIKHTLSIFFILVFSISKAQDYKFIPANQYLLSDEQVKTMQIMITPNVFLFDEQGKILPMSQMQLMANPEYKPLFYADANGKIQSVIFQKKSNHPVLIEKNPEAHFEKGEKALDFITTNLQGENIKLSDLKGKVVVLNFWFTKCGPCIQEIPSLNELVNEYKDKGVAFIAITFNKKELVEQFLEKHPFKYTIAPNANDVVSTYNVSSYPTSIVINQEGEIVLKELGFRTNIKSVLSTSINNLLN